jgi:two-component system sensor histidine kinase BaeS
MRRSFAFRLAAAFAGVGIAAAALTAILVNLSFGSRFTGYLESQQRLREQQLVAALADSYTRTDGWNVADLGALSPLAFMDGGTLQLLDASGRVVWAPSESQLAGPMAAMHRQMMGGGSLAPEQSLPITVNGTRVGTALVRLPQSGLLPQDLAFRSSVNRLLLFGGIAAGLAALLLGLFLARRATRPARDLASAAQAFAQGDRSRRAEYRGADEFGDMARSFNSMADTVEEEDRLRRTFAGDVAHEIRTPLAILQSQIEALQDGVTEASPSELESLHEETLRLRRLVGDLETLASADAASFTLAMEPVELGAVAREVTREFAGPFEVGGVTLTSDLQHVIVDGDPIRLRQIAANLLSNALKFTPEGGKVRMELEREGDRAVLRVSDTGVGIPPDELPHIFDRFFRGREVRAGGSGIGLTVVRELVSAHGGEVDASSEPGSGTTFTVRILLASSPLPTSFTDPSHGGPSVRAERRR